MMTLWRKFLSYVDMEIGSLIFGLAMAVTGGLGILACVGSIIYFNLMVILGYNMDMALGLRPLEEITLSRNDIINFVLWNTSLGIVLIFLLLDFSFSIVLCIGASKKKYGHLKAYFIYGSVKSILTLLVAIILLIVLWDNVPGSILLTLSVFNSLMLVIVYGAYKKIMYRIGYNEIDNQLPIQVEM